MILKLKHLKSSSRLSLKWLSLTASLVAFGLVQILNPISASADTASVMWLTTSATSYTVGSNVSVGVYEWSGSSGIFGAQASFSYPDNLLEYTGISTAPDAFNVAAPSTAGNGQVVIDRGSTLPLTNSELIATVDFKTIAPGTVNLTFTPSCTSTPETHCSSTYGSQANVNTFWKGYTYSFPVTGSASPVSSGAVAAAALPSFGSSSSNLSSKYYSSLFTPVGTVTPTTVANNGSIKAAATLTVQPATLQLQDVKEVDYFINHKLVNVSKTAPYAYQLNTKKFLNGSYSLVSNTVYTTGRVGTSAQRLEIANPLSWSQVGLFVRHYLTIPLIIILLGLIVWMVILIYKRRPNQPDDGSGYGPPSGGGSSDHHGLDDSLYDTPVIQPNRLSKAKAVSIDVDDQS